MWLCSFLLPSAPHFIPSFLGIWVKLKIFSEWNAMWFLWVLTPHLDSANKNWECWVRWGKSTLILEISDGTWQNSRLYFFNFTTKSAKSCHGQHLGTSVVPDSAFIYLFNKYWLCPYYVLIILYVVGLGSEKTLVLTQCTFYHGKHPFEPIAPKFENK